MGKKTSCAQVVTRWIDSLIDNFDLAKNRYMFALVIFAVVLTVSIQPLLLFFTLRGDVHVEFWLGPLPIVLNLAVPVTLFFMFLILPCCSVCNCRFSHSCLRGFLLFWFTASGSLIVGYGLFVLQHTYMVSYDLVYTCGESATSARVQEEWQRLLAFHESCQQLTGRRDIFVQQCAGFWQMEEPPHDIFVSYIEEMEMDYECRGFCDFWKRPFFNMNASEGERCASVLGRHLFEIGNQVGLPMIAIGALAVTMGTCMFCYEHL